jgi:hypothetical protein
LRCRLRSHGTGYPQSSSDIQVAVYAHMASELRRRLRPHRTRYPQARELCRRPTKHQQVPADMHVAVYAHMASELRRRLRPHGTRYPQLPINDYRAIKFFRHSPPLLISIALGRPKCGSPKKACPGRRNKFCEMWPVARYCLIVGSANCRKSNLPRVFLSTFVRSMLRHITRSTRRSTACRGAGGTGARIDIRSGPQRARDALLPARPHSRRSTPRASPN